MNFGLTFMSVAAAGGAQRRWAEDARARRERLDRHQRLTLPQEDSLTAAERSVLNNIAQQLKSDEPRESKRHCPECDRPFQLLDVGASTGDTIEIDSCPFCRGIWFDAGELATLAGLKSESPEPDKATRPSRYPCPECQAPMTEFALFHPLNLLVDRCPAGHGVYLEDRELERVFEVG